MKKEFNFRIGFEVEFNIDGNEIKLKASSYSGSEELFLNGELISKTRTFSTSSEHTFSIDNINYKIQMDCSNLMKGPWFCTLYKEDEKIEQQQISFMRKKKTFKDYIKVIGIFIVFVCILFFIGISFDLPSYFVSIPIFFILFILLYPKAYIEVKEKEFN